MVTTRQGVTYTESRYPRRYNTRGLLRRTMILNALEAELEVTPWRTVSIPIVARDASCAASAFYLYFANLDDAFRALVKRKTEQGRGLTRHELAVLELLDVEKELGDDGGKAAEPTGA